MIWILLYIKLDEKSEPIGLISLDYDKDGEIEISMDNSKRGKGCGTEVLKKISVIGLLELGFKN